MRRSIEFEVDCKMMEFVEKLQVYQFIEIDLILYAIAAISLRLDASSRWCNDFPHISSP